MARKSTKKKEKAKNNNKNYLLIAISLILILISLLINRVNAIRPIICVIASLILAFTINNLFSLKKTKTIPYFIILIILTIILDGIVVTVFKRIPIYSYNIITNNNTIVYNAIGIRVWQCDKDDYTNLYVDPFYQKGYTCNTDDLETIDSNSFLNSIVENYDEYKNQYVKIKGKISKKSSQTYIEMQPYETTDITVNGYVTFADNITLRIFFESNESALDSYDVYDEITIVGEIKNLDKSNDKYIIYMSNSKVVSDKNLNNFTISAVSKNSCNDEKNLVYKDDKNIYTYCLTDIIVSFDLENQYELVTALSANKISITDLYKDALNEETNEEDGSTMYHFKDYNVLVCNSTKSNDIILGSSNMTFSSVSCDSK